MYRRQRLPNFKPRWISEKIDIKELYPRLVKQREDLEDSRPRHGPKGTRAKPKKSSVESADSDNVPMPRPAERVIGLALDPKIGLGINLGSHQPSESVSADPGNMARPRSSVSNSGSIEPVVGLALDPKLGDLGLGINLGSHRPSEPASVDPDNMPGPSVGNSDCAEPVIGLALDPKLGLDINLGSRRPSEPKSSTVFGSTARPEVQPLVGLNPAFRRKRMPKPSAKSLKYLGLYDDFRFGMKREICDIEPVMLGKVAREVDVGPAVSMALPEKLMKEFPETSSDLKTIIRAKTPAGQKARKRKQTKYDRVLYQDNGKLNTNIKADLIVSRTLVVVVRVYWPNPPKPMWRRRRTKPKLCQIIVMLGSQTLDQLRDKIKCTMDSFTPEECSKLPHKIPSHTNKDVYKSGFFFINDVFYNDYRSPTNFDYSEVIRKWADHKKIGPFETSVMETTKMEELTVQLGQPYLYQHQGHCEHLFSISDIRLLSETEPRSLAEYPYVLYEAVPKVKMCFMCGKSPACWMTLNDARVPYHPSCFCDKCYYSFNYIDGKMATDFLSYHSTGPMYKP